MARDRRLEVKRVLMVALTINVAMTLLKMLVGLASGSLAVVADAMHSATDALSSLTGLITNGLSDPKPDRDHPYGHHKYEGIGALAVAGFIFFTAIEILITSSERLAEGLPELRINATELLLLLLVLHYLRSRLFLAKVLIREPIGYQLNPCQQHLQNLLHHAYHMRVMCKHQSPERV